jgi:F-type H+-transporting ATPase subunit a
VFLVGFTGLEVVVAFLQALIFTVLTCIYLNDALHMHH